MEDADFAQTLALARAGDEEAMSRLLRTFEDEVRMVVRARLPRLLRSRFDSMDFVQAVWKSVLVGEISDSPFANARHFRGFLAAVAQNKVTEAFRRNTRTRKFDLGREEPLYIRRGDRDAPRDLPSSDPSPSQEAQAEECFDRLIAGRPESEAAIVSLRRQGLTFAEIAARTGLNEAAARRVIEAARRRLEPRSWE